jgi:hypothetical protein
MKGKGPGTRGWGLAVLVGLGFACFVASVSASAQAKESPAEAGLTMKLQVYDYAQVAPADWARAKEEATRILFVAGVEAVWRECVMTAEGPQGEACRGRVGSDALVLRILSRAMAERVPSAGETFGFAQDSTDGQPATVASVFYHRVQRLADDLGFSRGEIMGHALVHEIGHLLLGAHSHTANGIMRASWKRKDLINASMGGLCFLPQQAQHIRGEIMARTRPGRAPNDSAQVRGK